VELLVLDAGDPAGLAAGHVLQPGADFDVAGEVRIEVVQVVDGSPRVVGQLAFVAGRIVVIRPVGVEGHVDLVLRPGDGGQRPGDRLRPALDEVRAVA
jgi:hypothetical protein